MRAPLPLQWKKAAEQKQPQRALGHREQQSQREKWWRQRKPELAV